MPTPAFSWKNCDKTYDITYDKTPWQLCHNPIFEQIVNIGHNPLTYDITYAILCPQSKMIRGVE